MDNKENEVKTEEEIVQSDAVETAAAAENGDDVAEQTAQTAAKSAAEVKAETAEKTEKVEPKKSRKQIKAEREEARKKELAGLSDDELYARIQTEKLLKSRKNKQIATLTSLVVAFALACCVILSAIVPVSYVPNCLSGEVSSVKLYASGSSSAVAALTEDGTAERYSTFKSLLKSAFSQSFLNALFSGSLSDYSIDESGGTSLGDYSGKDSSSLSKALPLAGDNCLIQFNFAEEQTLKHQNGKTYTSIYSGSSYDGTIIFNTAYLSVSTDEDSGVISTTIYVVGIYSYNDTYRLIPITTKADTGKIYASWSSLLP